MSYAGSFLISGIGFSVDIENSIMQENNNNDKSSEQQNTRNTENEFPGYPHYPAKEDIMRHAEIARVELDLDNISKSNKTSIPPPDKSVKIPQADVLKPALGDMDDDNIEIVHGTDADITPDDLLILDSIDGDAGNPELKTGDDLDVPGSEADDADEEIGEEDEEHNYYSIGGDAHENLEEDKAGE